MLDILLIAAGGAGGFGFNRWIKSIDYALEVNVFKNNEQQTTKEAAIEGLIDFLHHMPLWLLVAYLMGAGIVKLWMLWMNIYMFWFSIGCIISDLPAAIKRYHKTIKIMMKYDNLRKIGKLLAVAAAIGMPVAGINGGKDVANIISDEIKKIEEQLSKQVSQQPQNQQSG